MSQTPTILCRKAGADGALECIIAQRFQLADEQRRHWREFLAMCNGEHQYLDQLLQRHVGAHPLVLCKRSIHCYLGTPVTDAPTPAPPCESPHPSRTPLARIDRHSKGQGLHDADDGLEISSAAEIAALARCGVDHDGSVSFGPGGGGSVLKLS